MKKLFATTLAAIALTACGGGANETEEVVANDAVTTEETATDDAAEVGAIAVVMREEGSGSRGAFEEILGVNSDDDNMVTDAALIGQGNGGVATAVASNEGAIGYVSFETVVQNDNLRALSINGVEATHENVLSGDFAMARPFVVIYDEEDLSDLAAAFLVFMQSEEGIAALEEAGTIPDASTATAFDVAEFSHLAGTLTLGGSTSVERAALALGNMFSALLPNITVTYNSAGSGAGIRGAQEGTYDLGFSSRDIRESDDMSETANHFTMTMDGLAIVVNTENPLTNITLDELRAIFLGDIIDWSEVE